MLYVVLIVIGMLQPISFKQKQLQNSRVKVAYDEKENVVKKYFTEKNLTFENFRLFIRAFKKEQVIEIWVQDQNSITFKLLHTYEICASSGTLGPKRKEGDRQVPEGVYYIQHFNPLSNFYLSLGLNYPNASDKILGDPDHPGSNIYLHGNCVTVGCIPITDDKVKELYIMAVEAKTNGQSEIPVHIFPSKLGSNSIESLEKRYAPNQAIINFWKNLEDVYLDFENTHQLREVKINAKGMYYY